MMAEGQITLNNFFSTEQVIDEQLDKLEESEHFTTLKEKVFKTVRLPAGMYKLLIRQVSDLLNINILEILAGGWGKYSEFLQYLDKEKSWIKELFTQTMKAVCQSLFQHQSAD